MAFSAIIGATSGAIAASLIAGAWRGTDTALLAWGAGMANGAPSAAPLVDAEEATVSVVNQVRPTVVSVVIKRMAANGTSFIAGGGTGFFVSSDGLIVTNRHVVGDPTAFFTVIMNDGAELPAKVVSLDPFLDVALLRVAGTGYPVAVLGDSDAVRAGQTVIAVGNTLSAFHNTVTKGVVSGINRRVVAGDPGMAGDVIEHAIQTDAAINPGNSGGPLVNLLGEVVGVNTAVSHDGQSVGFAIPVNELKKAVTDVERYGRIVRPWLGVRYAMLDADLANAEGITQTRGALVGSTASDAETAVAENGPAFEAGLQNGDVILSVEGKDLGDRLSLGAAIASFMPGQTITLRVLRGEKTVTLEATLREFPTTPAS
jgi:serine protease Do